MAAPLGPKLQLPQLERIRQNDSHIADALEAVTKYVNQNTTPTGGNAVTPANSQTASKTARIKPLNPLNAG